MSGNAKVANRSKLIGRWQHIEYVIGFNIDRRVTDLLRCITTIPGAVGAFRRSALTQVGGVSEDTLAEDTDLTMAICAAGWRVVYEENARAWTEAPVSFRQLWRQRYRWSYGTMQSMWKHRRAIFASGAAGRMGRVGLANLALFQVLLPLPRAADRHLPDLRAARAGPGDDPDPVGAVLVLQMLVALLAFAMERDKPWPVLWMPLQQLAYRQMMYAVLIKSIGTALAGVRLRWQKLKRVGEFGALSTPPALPDLPPMPTAVGPVTAPAPIPAGFGPAPVPAPNASSQVPAPIWHPPTSIPQQPAVQPQASWSPDMPQPAIPSGPAYAPQSDEPGMPGPALRRQRALDSMTTIWPGPPPVTTPPPWPVVSHGAVGCTDADPHQCRWVGAYDAATPLASR